MIFGGQTCLPAAGKNASLVGHTGAAKPGCVKFLRSSVKVRGKDFPVSLKP